MIRPTPIVALSLLAAVAAVSLSNGPPAAALQNKGPGAVARCESVAGALLERNGEKWHAVKKGDSLPAGAVLVAVPKAEIRSANGAVALHMDADIGKRGPYPILESAVQLRHDPKADLDIRFERGLIGLANLREEGPATVNIHCRKTTWKLSLLTPKTTVALELYSRQPPGLKPLLDTKSHDPLTSVALLVLKGKVRLQHGDKTVWLTAPPGPAKVEWNSYTDGFAAQHLDELPKGARPLDGKDLELFNKICATAKAFNGDPVASVIARDVKSDDRTERLLAVTVAGAVDDLPHVLEGLTSAKHADLRNHTVIVLRHWLGRDTGQVKKLVKELTLGQKYTLAQARTVVQLLLGFSEQDRHDANTYDLLIAYLDHSKLAVRELAHWHLVRLVPEGKDITYDAAGVEAERKQSIAQWRKLIPQGKLPQPGASAGNK